MFDTYLYQLGADICAADNRLYVHTWVGLITLSGDAHTGWTAWCAYDRPIHSSCWIGHSWELHTSMAPFFLRVGVPQRRVA
jgi:hypothetical protein